MRDCVLTLDSLTALRDKATCLRPQDIRTGMERMAYADKGTSPAARYTRNYYSVAAICCGSPVWGCRR